MHPAESPRESRSKSLMIGRFRLRPTTLGVEGYHLLAVAAALSVGLLLRVYRIEVRGLWIDEAFSVWLARQPLDEMIHWVREVDHHPPLYYGLLNGWVSFFGDGEGAVRLLSALFGTVNIALIYVAGRRLVNSEVGTVAAWVLALSPFHVRFGQEARMYTLLTLWASLALVAFVTLWRSWGWTSRVGKGARRGPLGRSTSRSSGPPFGMRLAWPGYVLSTAAMLWTHNTAVFFPAAANVVVLARFLARHPHERARFGSSAVAAQAGGSLDVLWLRRWMAAQGTILILWSPWLPALVAQAVDVYRRFWLPTPTVGTVVSMIGVLLWDFAGQGLLVPVLVSTALGALALFGLRELRRSPWSAAWIGVFFLLPLAAQWAVSAWRPILAEQTIIWTSIPLYLMLAAGIEAMRSRAIRRSATSLLRAIPLVVLIVVQALGVGVYYRSGGKEAWDDAAALVAERLRPGDVLLFNDAWGQIPFDYYLAREYNRGESPRVVKHGVPVDLFDRGVLEPEMTRRDLGALHDLIAGRRRVWLIYSHAWYTDPEGLVPKALNSAMELQQRWAPEGIEVHLYKGG